MFEGNEVNQHSRVGVARGEQKTMLGEVIKASSEGSADHSKNSGFY